MDITFKLIDVIIFIGICQGIFLSLTLLRIANHNKKANIILSILIGLSTFMLIGRFLMIRFFSQWVFMYSLIFDVTLFLFGPLFYSYVKRLLLKEERESVLPRIHFLPALLFVGMTAYYFIRYDSKSYYALYQKGDLQDLFIVLIALGIASNGYYLWKSFRILKQFKKVEKREFSFQQSPVKFLSFFLMAIALILLAWTFSFINSVAFHYSIPYLRYDIVWAVIPIFIYVIGYFSLRQPELFRIPEDKEKNTATKDRLSKTEALLLQKKLDSLMLNEKVFLQNDLTLADVSEMLQTSTNNVSWLLNRVYKSTFYDFINSYRVKEFVKKVENQEHLKLTILALSMDVGFNSKSTFNKAFKDAMKDTPSNFIKKYRAA